MRGDHNKYLMIETISVGQKGFDHIAAVVSGVISERIVSQFLEIVDDDDKMSPRIETWTTSSNSVELLYRRSLWLENGLSD